MIKLTTTLIAIIIAIVANASSFISYDVMLSMLWVIIATVIGGYVIGLVLELFLW